MIDVKRAEPDEKVKQKLMPDAAMRLAFLHANRVMHWDIKLDSFLVFSFESLSEREARRLLKFEKYRLAMTDMTLTKGTGTQTNLAPVEVRGR